MTLLNKHCPQKTHTIHYSEVDWKESGVYLPKAQSGHYIPGTILSILHVLTYLMLKVILESVILISILQMRKSRYRKDESKVIQITSCRTRIGTFRLRTFHHYAVLPLSNSAKTNHPQIPQLKIKLNNNRKTKD